MATSNILNLGLSGSSGSGSFVGSTSPTLVTPTLGVAAATSINFGGSVLSTYTTRTSWTPTISFVTPGNLSVSYATRLGFYNVIGSKCFIVFSLVFTPTYTTASGALQITSLPFTSENTNGIIMTGGGLTSTSVAYPASQTMVRPVNSPNTSIINLTVTKSGGVSTLLTTSSFPTATQRGMVGFITIFI